MGSLFLILSLLTIPSLCGAATAYVLLIWFDNARFFIEYMNLFHLNKIFPHISKYTAIKQAGLDVSYFDFLAQTKNNFLTRLISCEKCFSIWINGAFYLPLYLYLVFTLTSPLLVLTTVVSPAILFSASFLSLKFYKQIK